MPGVQQYLALGVVLNVTIVAHASEGRDYKITSNDLEKGGYIYLVGKIAPPPSQIAPLMNEFHQLAQGTKGKHDWLVTKCDVRLEGSAIISDVEFTLSDWKGWNKLVYPDTTSRASTSSSFYQKTL